MPPRVCLLTVHGIGFRQPPIGETDGYADRLHAHLRDALPAGQLGEDPALPADPRRRPGGPVYVQSEWKGSRKEGLARLDEPLIAQGSAAHIAHVALVYSKSLPAGHHLDSTLETASRAVLSLHRYSTVAGALRLLGRDLWAVVHRPRPERPAASNLRPRSDVDGTAEGDPSRSPNVLSALQADVATYVCRNDLRERVRGFVQQAIERLLKSGNVDALVVNAHSQGTVLCWDVLCRLPLSSSSAEDVRRARKLRAFVTAGSPIRKYVRLFDWGGRVGRMEALSAPAFVWRDYWDPRDPVADPLNPPVSWRPGEHPHAPGPDDDPLLVAIDPDHGICRHFAVEDTSVDNVRNSSGSGLRAREYWNNTQQFVPEHERLLDECAAP